MLDLREPEICGAAEGDAFPDNTGEIQGKTSAWQPGQSGNPKGRPKGSRNKLSEAFLAELCADWEDHGREAIRRVREQSPEVYLRVVASVVPREVKFDTNPYEGWSDAELIKRHEMLKQSIAALGGGIE